MRNKIRLKFKLRKVFILSAIFFIIISSGCKKDGELVPEFDNGNVSVFFTDTFSLVTEVIREDSLRTDVSAFNLLGIYNDPIFGLTSSSFYSQVTLNGLSVDFGTAPVIDSVVLSLAYSDLYGDSTNPMIVDVFMVTELMSSETFYYSNDDLSINPKSLGTKTFVPNFSDSVFLAVDSSTLAPHLRVRLDDAFGQFLLNASPNDLESNNSFSQFLNGLHVRTRGNVDNSTLASGEGSIIYFNVNSPVSTVTIYYSNSADDSLSYNFLMNNTETAKYNRFDHNYTGTDIEAQMNGGGNTELAYIQSLAGVKTKLKIPDIKDLISDGQVIINKAELVITLEDGSDDDFEAIQTIQVVSIDEDGEPNFLVDFIDSNGDINVFGGPIDQETKTYTFNISRHVHSLLYDTPIDFGMYIISTSSSITANRSVIGTESNPVSKMKLNITYSKF